MADLNALFSPFDKRSPLARVKDDIVDTVSNYIEGAKQGINELSRAQDEQTGHTLEQMFSPEGYQMPTAEQNQQQNQYVGEAQKAVMNETVLPALAFNPTTTVPAIGTMLMGGATDTYQNTEGDTLDKAGNAVRAITYGPVVDMYNDPNVLQNFHDRPVSTLASGAMALGQAVLPIVGARYGVKKAGELKDDLVAHVEKQIDGITDNPPLQNTGIRGLDALDQYDSPTRGFRPATPDEMAQAKIQTGQNFGNVLDQILQQKKDETYNTNGNEILKTGEQQLGKPYSLGADGVEATDCGKFTQDVFAEHGIDLGGRTADRQYLNLEQAGKSFSDVNQAQPGDLVFFDVPSNRNHWAYSDDPSAVNSDGQAYKGVTHVGIYAGDGKVLQAGSHGVSYAPLDAFGDVVGFGRAAEGKNVFDQQAQPRFTTESVGDLPPMALEDQMTPLMQTLEQIKGQKFDEANGQAYSDFMQRQADESSVLQARKNEIAGSVLMNPLDRMEVGADLPFKTRLGGQGEVLGERPNQSIPNEIYLGDKQTNQPIIQERQPRYTQPQQQRPFLPTAEQLINERSMNNIYRDNGIAKEVYAKPHEELVDRAIKLHSGFDPTGGRFDNVNIRQAIKNVGDKIYDSAVNRILEKPERTRYTPRERQNFNPNNPVEYSLSKWDKVYQAMLDDKHPLSKLPDNKDTYYKARIANGKAYGVAEELLKREDIDSLEQILKPVKHDLTGFSEYLEAVHSVDQYTQGYKTAMPVEHMQKVMDSATPAMKEAQQKIVKYNNKLLEKLVDGGILTRESVDAMKAKFQNYVPFMRDFSDTDAMETFIKSKGNINVSNPIKKLKGSEREIVDPLESIIKNTYTFTNLAERNKVGQAFAKLAENPEFDNIVIKMDGETTANPKLSQFTVWENGKKQAYQTTPELYRAMASLDAEGTNFVMRMIAAPASLLRAGATLTPDFMARNIVRDAIGAFVNTKGFIPGIDSYKGLKHAIKKDSTYWEWMREGGGMATMVGLDRNYLGTTVKQMRTKTLQEKVTTAINPNTAIELLRTMSEKSELATRIGVYESAIKRGATPLEAIMESREASMDFGRSGTIGKNINNITAFFNASLQGTDKMIRTLSDPKTRGRAALNIGLSIVLPSLVTWYMGKDDERIQRLPAWQKDLFWVIPTSGKGAGWDGLIRIPKPFEVGVFFGSGTERMLDWAFKKNPNAFKGYGESVKGAITPSLIPTALIPLAEWWGNKSYFSGQDIVPRREQGLPDKYQYGVNTSSTAKLIGSLTNTSPRKIDNTIRGYTGGLGTKVTEGIDLIGDATGTISRNAPSKPITSMPVISGFTATSYRNSQPMQDYYDAQKKAEQSIAEAKLTGEKADKIQQQNHAIINNSKKAMDAMHKEQRRIESDKNLNPDQKRSKLDDLQLRETKLAEAIIKRLK